MSDLQLLIHRAESLLARLEQFLPTVGEPDWKAGVAYRWRRRQTAFGVQAALQPVRTVSDIRWPT
jgi:predicted AAA+ superfamily ATPase